MRRTRSTRPFCWDVWTCETKDGAMSGEKVAKVEVIKFFSVIRLKMSNGAMKVGVDISIK